jgi:hypothetical protein
MVTVVVLHVVMLTLLATALAPRRSPYAYADTPMTLIVIPPADPPRGVVVPQRLTPAPALSRSNVVSPPVTPADITPVPDERAPIDWARAAELAARHQVEVIELERRRARGFTPGVQREPELTPSPVPQFGWSRAATQPVEALPDGGTLIRLNERCVTVINPIHADTAFDAATKSAVIRILPSCGIGTIPANGSLFEHMNDPAVVGDRKDDSSLPR